MEVFKNKRLIRHIGISPGNPRNSEGDFFRLPDGRIIFAYSRFRGEDPGDFSGSDIAAIFSDDNGESFGDERILFKAEQFDTHNIMSVSFIGLGGGDIGLFFGVRQPCVTTQYRLASSSDGGESFNVISALYDVGLKGYYVINNGRVIRLASGRLLVPTAQHRTGYDKDGNIICDGRGMVHFLYSDDDGLNWTEARTTLFPTFINTQTGLQEPGVVQLPNGSIYCFMRTDQGVQYESFSVDDGDSWTLPQPSVFTSPASPMAIKRSPFSGIYYAVYNPTPAYNGRDGEGWCRTPLAIRSSTDGRNFGDPQIIEQEPGHGYCYPAIFFPDPDSILLSYCSGGPEESGFVLSRTTITKLIL